MNGSVPTTRTWCMSGCRGFSSKFESIGHDTVSKYTRGAENDLRWIEAGYDAKILDLGAITVRAERVQQLIAARKILAEGLGIKDPNDLAIIRNASEGNNAINA
ncbi:MAG: hypothetical protein CPSOU_6687, partial [uncultured Paraburkholderia sp.]